MVCYFKYPGVSTLGGFGSAKKASEAIYGVLNYQVNIYKDKCNSQINQFCAFIWQTAKRKNNQSCARVKRITNSRSYS